ncbi:aminoacyl-tRNA hydrolase [Mycoplasma sp. Mirounga ES2805-ORL]|uniref:aminoacyl-tRNA hydrolase n=1 Tax=Mycoplasma sp. Mirounga ES2805-ORL TaxID=754514 RepID=UPI00197B0917|nr:aminoacyl-tRNA hydrolase [Mycoplasma sp. Mirounga ES2805-ORL]QSF13506.1 aminoacyl-tRNA hydrolase [Mycoplasma sp. Mirounga ES2805-ORL]
MKLVVGLGNPGKEYQFTRHNSGFLVIDKILEKLNTSLNKEKFNGQFVVTEDVIIAKPLTFMNNSGEFVQAIAKYFKILSSDIMIIYDEKDFNLGQAAIKIGGSTAGHNGVISVEKHLGSNDFKKMRIGIGRDSAVPLRDYVLSKFSKDEMIEFEEIANVAADAAISFVYNDIKTVMEKFNVNRKK